MVSNLLKVESKYVASDWSLLVNFLNLRCLLSREILNSKFSASFIDVLDRFQENKVLQTAQIINNVLRSSKKW